MIGLSPPARYSVILMLCTRGSSAACSMNASVLLVKLSYGWWTKIARSRITENERAVGLLGDGDAPGGDRRPRAGP